ncbi:protein phosphatase 2C 70 isoform X2 [Syzygium oleosum]|uniref:protein phosphatase 2C 70 isoform X2 n=1 Tax=Syzygium oleosum TaxID=219896 RepID=UPI0011D25E10|nr:protein phosphatase 2C 70 isoform X2 [Syzygium oleosum]
MERGPMTMMAMSILSADVAGLCVGLLLILMLLLILLAVVLACKPWRFLRRLRPRSALKVDDLETPLVSEDANIGQGQSYEPTRTDLEGSRLQWEGYMSSPRNEGLVHKQRLPSSSPGFDQDVVTEPLEDAYLGQTLKRSLGSNLSFEEQKRGRKEELSSVSKITLGGDGAFEHASKDCSQQRSCLTLEVISGPSQGTCFSIRSTDTSKLPLTLGRVTPCDLLLKDSEVSGRHAMINWNLNNLKWELIDLGSLNGTLLNSQPINHPDTGSRLRGDPTELASGDIITLGTTSNVYVRITSQAESRVPFGVGMASDPMSLRRGAKKLPMEDVCYYQWPLPGLDQFGLFGICDGHGGAGAAESASKLLPEMVATLLSDSLNRERVLSLNDASHVLRNAFYQTEACMNHSYEGCTATLLLIWADGEGSFYAQCANVGDSACLIDIDGNLIKMTEDHRVTSYSERLRIKEIGEALKDGETRLCGLNLARMLGDKFLKQQDGRFSSEPHISQVVLIDKANRAFALMASDGLWDVISMKKSVQLVLQTMERYSAERENVADKIANSLLTEARNLRTKDNTSIILLDFSNSSGASSCRVAS